MGLSRAGFQTALSFDNDHRCVETQLLNSKYFEKQIIQASVEEMLGGELLRRIGKKPGELDLLAGGPPCQGFSVQRIGADEDGRNDVLIRYFELIKEVMPKYFILENVKGLAGKRGRQFLQLVISGAEELGYFSHVKVLDAQDFDVPQRRQRIFLVGERLQNGQDPIFTFPKPTTPDGERITVRMAIGTFPEPPEDGSDHPEYIHHRRDRLSELNKKRLAALKPGQGCEYLPFNLLANCHKVGPEVIGHRNVYGRMAWNNVAPTITARFDSFTRGLFGHPEQIRSISLREGAELQTFPTDMIFSGTKVEIARQIGNAVPIRLADAVGKSISKCLHERS